jgi:CRISPR-associated protein Csm4
MPTYRITLSLKSPLGTDLVSGTLWGHLAWAVRYLEGDAALGVWLEEQEDHPWLLSSQMPVDMLPRPLLKPRLLEGGAASLEAMKLDKASRKVGFIPEALFLELREKMSDTALTKALQERLQELGDTKESSKQGLKPHNRIDRLTGTTPESGGLFFEEVYFPSGNARRQLFLHAPTPCRERLEALFNFIGNSGFGSNASTGNGHFSCSIAEERELFQAVGSRAVSLSHGVISRNMGAARYKQHVHFGKLGGDYARGGYSPFKYPLLMSRPGATFDPVDSGPFGALLRGVHHDPALDHLRHHALHLPLAFTEVAP